MSKVENILITSLDQIITHSRSLGSVGKCESTHEMLASLPWVLTGPNNSACPLP